MQEKKYATAQAALSDSLGQQVAETVDLSDSDLTDETLAQILDAFPRLNYLQIAHTAVTEKGLAELAYYDNVMTVKWHDTDSSQTYRDGLEATLGLEVIDERGNSSLTGMIIW
jgi:hypothetical protein